MRASRLELSTPPESRPWHLLQQPLEARVDRGLDSEQGVDETKRLGGLLRPRIPRVHDAAARVRPAERAHDPVRSARLVVAGILVGQQRPLLVAEEGDRAALERLVVKQNATRSPSGVRYTHR